MRSFSKVVLAFDIANKGKGNFEKGHGPVQFFPRQKKFFGFFGFFGLSFVGLSFVGLSFVGFVRFVIYTFSLFRQSWLLQGRPWPP